jgi:hypothetical protein
LVANGLIPFNERINDVKLILLVLCSISCSNSILANDVKVQIFTPKNFLEALSPPQLMSTIIQVPHGYIFSFNQINNGCLMYAIVVLIIFNGWLNGLKKIPSPSNSHAKLCNIVII